MTGKIKVEREMKGKIDKKSYGKKIKEVWQWQNMTYAKGMFRIEFRFRNKTREAEK